MSGNGWTLWLEMVAQEYRERMLRSLPDDFFGDTRPCQDITDGLEVDTEPYDTRRFPTALDGVVSALREDDLSVLFPGLEDSSDGTLLQ